MEGGRGNSLQRLGVAVIIFNGVIQLLIYDLHAQLKPHPKPPNVTHYCAQLRCICVVCPHTHTYTRTLTLPNNRGKCHTNTGKQRTLQANGNLLSLLFSQLRPLEVIHSNQLQLYANTIPPVSSLSLNSNTGFQLISSLPQQPPTNLNLAQSQPTVWHLHGLPKSTGEWCEWVGGFGYLLRSVAPHLGAVFDLHEQQAALQSC